MVFFCFLFPSLDIIYVKVNIIRWEIWSWRELNAFSLYPNTHTFFSVVTPFLPFFFQKNLPNRFHSSFRRFSNADKRKQLQICYQSVYDDCDGYEEPMRNHNIFRILISSIGRNISFDISALLLLNCEFNLSTQMHTKRREKYTQNSIKAISTNNFPENMINFFSRFIFLLDSFHVKCTRSNFSNDHWSNCILIMTLSPHHLVMQSSVEQSASHA